MPLALETWSPWKRRVGPCLRSTHVFYPFLWTRSPSSLKCVLFEWSASRVDLLVRDILHIRIYAHFIFLVSLIYHVNRGKELFQYSFIMVQDWPSKPTYEDLLTNICSKIIDYPFHFFLYNYRAILGLPALLPEHDYSTNSRYFLREFKLYEFKAQNGKYFTQTRNK